MTHWMLSCDPGAKPGFALWKDGELYAVGWGFDWQLPEEVSHLDALVLEGQHVETRRRNNKTSGWHGISRSSQQSLSFSAGRLFERFDAQDKYVLPVKDWRGVLWARSGRLKKPVVLSRFRLCWPELAARADHVPKTFRGDVTEAIAIGYAWVKLPKTMRAKYLKH